MPSIIRLAEIAAAATQIETADHVHHAPSGEVWVVAYVKGDRLCACGWPESLTALSHCSLVKRATPEERMTLLHEMANTSDTDDSRNRYARAAIAALETAP